MATPTREREGPLEERRKEERDLEEAMRAAIDALFELLSTLDSFHSFSGLCSSTLHTPFLSQGFVGRGRH